MWCVGSPLPDVRTNSVNFENILLRESPAFPKGNLVFKAQYQTWVWGALGRKASEDGGPGLVIGLSYRRESGCCH